MYRTSRRTAAVAVIAGIGVAVCAAANGQWGYASGPTYLHAPGGTVYEYGVTSRYSLYAPSYAYAAPYGYAVPAYVGQAGFASAYGYGYGDPYQDFKWRRGKTRHGIYTPYAGPEEIEYKFRRDGSVHIDVDD